MKNMKRLLMEFYRANHQAVISGGIVIAVLAIGGILAMSISSAATYSVQKEAEDGTASGNYASVDDPAASGSKYIKFGNGGTPPPTPPGTSNCTPILCDPRQPSPDDLYTATDGSTNYFRSVIPDNPKLDANSDAIIGSMGESPVLNGPEWQITIFTTSNADPVYHPNFSADWGCDIGSEGMHIPDYATREVPGGGGGDGWVVTYNKDDKTIKSIWQAEKSGDSWNGSCGGTWPADGGGGVDSKKQGVGTGAEVQASAGFILYSELRTGAINHALYFTSTQSCSEFRPPAGKSDGNGGGNTCLPMGARIQLDPSVDCNGISGTDGEKMLCVTMQKYGGYILDSGGPGPISGIGIAGDDLTDPGRSAWETPGDGFRGSKGCSPIGDGCGTVASVGLTGSLDAIPWDKLRVLASWNGQ